MSQPNWKRPLGLAVTLVVLASAAYWSEFTRKPKKEEADEQEKKIVNLKDKQIHSLFISNGLGMDLTFNCVDTSCKVGNASKWEIGDPLKVKADDANINAFLSALNNMSSSDTISLKDETPEKKAALLKEYGLDPAQISGHKDREVDITTTDGTTAVYLGLQHPIGEGIFAAVEHVAAGQKTTGKINDNNVYVLPNFIKTNFEKDLTYWRNKKLFTIASHDVLKFHLKTLKSDIEGAKLGGAWILSSKGEDTIGDNEGIDTLLTGATYLVAKNFVADHKTDPQARAALKGAKQVITFSLTAAAETPAPSASPAASPAPPSETVTLTLYQKADGKPEKNGAVHMKTLATVSNLDPLFELENYSLERLGKELKDLRLSKLITAMDRFSAKNLKFEGGSLPQPVVLNMKDSKWVQEANAKGTVDSDKIQTLLDKLSSLKIVSFLPLAQAPSVLKGNTGSLKMTIGDGTNMEKHKFEFWKVVEKDGSKLYARDLTSKRPEIFLMDNQLTEALPWAQDKFEDKFMKAQSK
jgi:hypothetical protein